MAARVAAHGALIDTQALSEVRETASRAARRSTRAVVTAPADARPQRGASPFNLLGPYRYLHSPAVDVQAGGQPGLTGGGIVEVQTAIQRWNNAGAPIRFAFGGSSAAARCSGQFLNNGHVTITFMDPCGEMANDGGTLALGGSYYMTGEGGSANGRTFGRAVEGFIVNNDSALALRYLTNPGCFEDIQAHELGHVLGLDHSADPTAIMFATIDSAQCWNGARRLGADDIQGLHFIYGGTTPASAGPPTVAPSDVRVVTRASDLTVSWHDISAGSVSSTSSYRVDFRAGHQDGGPIVASVVQNGMSLTVAVPPEVSGAFNVIVSAINSAGAGPPSPRFDFTLGGAPAACATAPQPPTGVTAVVRDGFATVQWSPASGATRYFIQAGSDTGIDDLLGRTDLGGATRTGAAVPSGFRAWIRVFAANACGLSAGVDVLLQ
jgi:hypothetical protein